MRNVAFGNRQRIGHAVKTMAHQGDRRGFNSDIAAAAHGDPDIRLGQRRASLIPSPTIATLCPWPLQTLNGIGFTVRQHAGDHFINAGSLAIAFAVVGLSPVSITSR